MVLLPVIAIFLLSLIVYQDYRFRAVSWILFPFLGINFSVYSIFSVGIPAFLWNTLFNLLFLAMQLLLLTVFFSIKNRQLINISHAHLGWGDILFLAVLCFLLAPLNFMVFYFGSTLIVLVVTGIQLKKNPNAGKIIPLAGMQAFLLIPVLIYGYFSGAIPAEHWSFITRLI